jgi:ribonuclease PH
MGGGRYDMTRLDGRIARDLRKVKVETGFIDQAPESVLFSMGRTKVLCTATVSEGVPKWLENRLPPQGWVTAEYSLLPRSTNTRSRRERKGVGGRTQEIQRLIGRSLRAGVDMNRLGARSVMVDCDILEADGGTRTASITGGWLALARAIKPMLESGELRRDPLISPVAAVSVGLVDGEALLDLNYEEDSVADVDMNVVMNGNGDLIEVQATAEGHTFSRSQLEGLLDLAHKGIDQLIELQAEHI